MKEKISYLCVGCSIWTKQRNVALLCISALRVAKPVVFIVDCDTLVGNNVANGLISGPRETAAHVFWGPCWYCWVIHMVQMLTTFLLGPSSLDTVEFLLLGNIPHVAFR